MEVSISFKTCSRCGDEKAFEEFTKHKSGKFGLHPECRECKNEKQKVRRESGASVEWEREYRKTPEGRAKTLLNHSQHRAKQKNLPYDLDREWLLEKINNGVCEVTGLPLSLDDGSNGTGTQRPWTPSLDRIDNSKGYTKDNTQLVCWAYNRAKGVDSHDAVVTLAEAICKTKSA